MYPQFTTYTWFLYLGIAFFVTHILLYGISLDLSYFGLFLIYIGWAKPVLSDWFRYILWFFIFLDIYSNFNAIRVRLTRRGTKVVKIVKKSKNSEEDV
jgi:hypothetical protein